MSVLLWRGIVVKFSPSSRVTFSIVETFSDMREAPRGSGNKFSFQAILLKFRFDIFRAKGHIDSTEINNMFFTANRPSLRVVPLRFGSFSLSRTVAKFVCCEFHRMCEMRSRCARTEWRLF
jgi:hypothetical protein